MNRTVAKVAASSLVLGLSTVGCQMDGARARVAGTAQAQGRAEIQAGQRADQDAARFAREGATAANAGNAQAAITAMEQAVALSPRDAGYRMTLAELYMRTGRFASAETTYGDVLAIDPSNNRAALSRALMMSARGNNDAAVAQLEQLEGQAPAADLGLAFALAGAPQRGVAILEPAARLPGANSRTRQNLALAYALAGNWQQARTVAEQDLSPSEVPQRMAQWASLSRADRPGTQVATLLGVAPGNDPGQPVQLALARDPAAAPAAAPIQVAAAEVEAAPAPVAVPVAGDAPVQVASVDTESVPMPADGNGQSAAAPSEAYAAIEAPEWGIDGNTVRLPAEEPEQQTLPAEVRYAAAADDLVRPDPTLIRRAASPIRRAASFARFTPVTTGAPASDTGAPVRAGSGRYVVQLGAFSNVENAERAWQQASSRFGLTESAPVTMTFDLGGRMLQRVAVGGFQDRGDAARLCGTIRARGGECFVRANAGDATIRWAARYARSGRA